MPSLSEYYSPYVPESGCDEAGRGCLAGPVVASAVILHQGWNHPLLDDSKKLSHSSRALLREVIEREAAHWAVGWVWPDEIDRINILNASFLAMHRALDQLAERPGHILVDGNRFTPYGKIPHLCVVKGDGKYRSIAAASILAKTHRDAYMEGLHHHFPAYAWNQNKGYPTPAHRAAIASFGSCVHHRQSFALMPRQLEFFAEEA